MFDQIALDIIDIDIEIPSLIHGNLNGKEVGEVPHIHEYENIGKIKNKNIVGSLSFYFLI